MKHLNHFVPYRNFKMDGWHCLRDILKKKKYMCKLDLKDVYISVLLNAASRKFVRFLWSRKLYEFLCLCFGLCPVPGIITKLSKIPVSMLRWLNVLIIVYLDDKVLIGYTIEKTLMVKYTIIFLIQQGHSTRSASTSKSCLSGISVDDIFSRRSWSN